ncbi:MAG: methylenetetrahydrofolate reductase [Ignavibacteriales bacterium]|nr:methylenetetrahydrofolate reductase [Ignavibacteriales bacterium]
MKIIEHLSNAKETLISFEIIPPKRGGDIKSLLATLDDIVKFNPPFIDITSHAAEVDYEETKEGIKVKVKRKRPGTLGICALIQNKYNIDAVPHVLCDGFTKEETEDFIIELRYLGIDNLIALKGDTKDYKKPVKYGRTINKYASDLVGQISNLKKGKYLEDSLLDADPMDFCVGVAGYPEKHFESPNIMADIKFIKKKVEAGADYIVTQMFFDNKKYYDYVELCRAEGIKVPIIPGLKIINLRSNVLNIPRSFHIDIPTELVEEVLESKSEDVTDIGVEWTYKQVEDLLNNSVPAIHFYIMTESTPIKKLMKKISK